MSPEELWTRFELLGLAPARRSQMDRYRAELDDLYRPILEYYENGKGVPISPWLNVMRRHVNEAYQAALAREKTAEQALKDAEVVVLEELKKFD
jgi:ABC-type glycerol-3-phosphate transport system substrate-binding protein